MTTLTRRHDDYPEIPGYHKTSLTLPVLLLGILDLVVWVIVLGMLVA